MGKLCGWGLINTFANYDLAKFFDVIVTEGWLPLFLAPDINAWQGPLSKEQSPIAYIV